MRFVVAALLIFVAALCAPLALLSRVAAGYRPLAEEWQPIGVDQLRPGARVVASGRGEPAAIGDRLRGRGRWIGGAALAALLGAALALLGRARWAGSAAAWCAVAALMVVVSQGSPEALTVLAASAASLGALGQSWRAWGGPCRGRALKRAGR